MIKVPLSGPTLCRGLNDKSRVPKKASFLTGSIKAL